jgi:hypothetical protein
MKCPNCGLDNRADARFCKQCGHPLQAQAAPPPPVPPSGTICPACGATASPGTRHCPRCGKPLPPAVQPPSPEDETLPSIPSPPLSSPPPAGGTLVHLSGQQEGHPFISPASKRDTLSSPPTSGDAPSSIPPAGGGDRGGERIPTRGLPGWVWGVAGIAAFLCILAFIAIVAVIRPKIFGAETEEAPTATPTPIELPTQAPPAEPPPTAPPATLTPTPPPPTEAPPAEVPPPSAFGARVDITPSAIELREGERLTITVTIANTGQVGFGDLRYQLLGEWEPALRLVTDPVVARDVEVAVAGNDIATFVLEAVQPGTGRFQANVTARTREEPPALVPVSSEQMLEISVAQQ